MEREAAVELANFWFELPRVADAHANYGSLTHALQTLLPEDVEKAGAAVIDDKPTVLALNKSSVFAVYLESNEDEHWTPVARRFPLAPDAIHVEVRDNLGGQTAGGIPAQLRVWRFSWADGSTLAFETVVRRHDGWRSPEDSGEGFAKALAMAVGWALP